MPLYSFVSQAGESGVVSRLSRKNASLKLWLGTLMSLFVYLTLDATKRPLNPMDKPMYKKQPELSGRRTP
jgi:hypothetical protein